MYAGVVVPNPRNSFPWWLLISVQSQVSTTSGIERILLQSGRTWLGTRVSLIWVALGSRRCNTPAQRGGPAPGAGSPLVEVGILVVPGQDAVQGVPSVLARILAISGLPERGVPLQKMDPNAVAVSGVSVPGARLGRIAERFLAESADLGRRADPRYLTGGRGHRVLDR